ncbi:MAG TPA: hypothetical protein VMI94_27950 [Bryobacteraceae bacterium]|nr:hypothetical protein [Bryobacteraceae bacterium]
MRARQATGERGPEPAWKREGRARLAEILHPMPNFVPQPFVSLNSYQARLERQRAMPAWLQSLDLEYLVTIKFNEELRFPEIWQRLKRIDAMLNHHWLGRDWQNFRRFPSPDRLFFVAFIERDRANYGVHAHLLLRRPRGAKVDHPRLHWRLPYIVTDKARRKGICPRGDIDIRQIEIESELATVDYCVKNLSQGGNSAQDRCVLSTEFHPKNGSPGGNAKRPTSAPSGRVTQSGPLSAPLRGNAKRPRSARNTTAPLVLPRPKR